MKKPFTFKGKVAGCSLVLLALLLATAPAVAQDKPNIVVIMGDDIGWIWNIGAYHRWNDGGDHPQH